MKLLLRILIVLMLPFCVHAQNGTYYDYFYYTQKRVDSLYHLYNTTGNDTVRMAVCRDLGLYFGETNSDSAFYFQSQELKIAAQLKLKLWIVDASDILGYIETKRGNFPAALHHFLDGIKLAEDPATEKDIWRVTKFSNDGDPYRARMTSLANIYNDLGLMYKSIGNKEKQIEWYNKSVAVSGKIKDYTVMSFTYENLGEVYMNSGQPDTAIKLIHQALEFTDIAKSYKFSGVANIALGNIYFSKQQFDSAQKYFQKAVNISLEVDNPSSEAYGYAGLADLYEKKDQTDSAFYYARKSLKIFTRVIEPIGKLQALQSLVNLFKKVGRIDSAFQYQQLAIAVKDSLQNAEKVKQFESIGFEQQLKLQELKSEKVVAQGRNRVIGLLGGLALLLIIGFILYRNNVQKQKANRILQNTLANLRSAQAQLIQSEKMASLGELTAGIAHEIQNPLNFVNNFSEVNAELIDELTGERSKVKGERNEKFEDEIIQDIRQNLEKINQHGKRADSIVKGMLQHSRTSSGQKEVTDINALCDEYLRLAYHGIRAKDKSFNAEIKTDLDSSIGKINIIPQDIGRVILNLVNNAFYAVNEKAKLRATSYEPLVIVNTKKSNGKVKITIRDNGNGIPQKIVDKIFQPFFTTKPTGQGTGLGLSLAYDIVKAHGGEIKVETKEGEGSEFVIQLPAKSNIQ